MRDDTSSDGSRVVLKLVDDDSDELAILEHLNEVKSASNHAIELHGVVDIAVTNAIALRRRTPLDNYFCRPDPPETAPSSPEQFLEGVAFLHEHRVAHLDFKPGNVVIDGVDRKRPSTRVLINDFSVSIFVEDEHNDQELSWNSTVGRAGGQNAVSDYLSWLVPPGWTSHDI
jgi:hypothetical protein